MSYWYLTGKDGRHYCYSKEATFVCRMGEWDALLEASSHLGCEPDKLARMIRRAHSSQTITRQRVEGRLTSLCSVCGSVMDRLGFRYWIEGPPPADATDAQRTSAAMNRRLFGGDGFVQLGPCWYAKTKNDAQAWARMRSKEEA